MATGKYAAKRARSFSKKSIVLLLALVLLLGSVIGGTVAWLIASPDPVINTFTYGDINIELDETDTGLDGDNNEKTNSYEMLPGQTITKDPVITVKAGSEDMWLFVKLEESDNFDNFMEYTVDGSWVALSGEDGVYYRSITAAEIADADLQIPVITDNTVTVKTTRNNSAVAISIHII